MYAQLRGALSGGVVRGSNALRTAPLRVNVLSLLIEIDGTVGSWESDGKSTVDRLHVLAGRDWRPMDTELMDDYSAQLQRRAVSATELLGPQPRVYLHGTACPGCDARHAYRLNNAGEETRVPALRVSEGGCKCAACGAFWPPERFEWLARLLGCEPLPA